MDLQEFIKVSLTQIVAGVKDAQEATQAVDGLIVQKAGARRGGALGDLQGIAFDVAVTVSDATQSKAGGGLVVFGVGLGGQRAKDMAHSSVSRIRFTVPVILPGQDI